MGKRSRADVFGKRTRKAVHDNMEGFGGDGQSARSDEAVSGQGAVGDADADRDGGIDLDAALVGHINFLVIFLAIFRLFRSVD